MNCLLRYYCLFRQKLLYPQASCRNVGSIFGCGCLNLSTVIDLGQILNARCYHVFLTETCHYIELRLSKASALTYFVYVINLRIKMWVLTAVSHCLRELDILHGNIDPAKSNILPSNLFTCKSLVTLKLDGEILLDVPRMVSLPSLKSLKLQRVRFFSAETLQRLLSNCPILEDLFVTLQGHDSTRKLSVVIPSLQSLSLAIPCNNDIDGYVIVTPALKYFKLRDYNRHDHYCLMENMPYLIKAYVDVALTDIKSLIGSVTSVKHLAICLEFAQNMLDEGFVFNQIEHIEVCTCTVLSSNQLFRLLKASSKLKRLDFSLRDGHEYQGMDHWNQPSTAPECMISSLQTLTWSTYIGEPQEREIVVYILKHALHLMTATIRAYGTAVEKLEMIKELSRSSRASTTCQLMFY